MSAPVAAESGWPVFFEAEDLATLVMDAGNEIREAGERANGKFAVGWAEFVNRNWSRRDANL